MVRAQDSGLPAQRTLPSCDLTSTRSMVQVNTMVSAQDAGLASDYGAVIQALAFTPGWSENNFQVIKRTQIEFLGHRLAFEISSSKYLQVDFYAGGRYVCCALNLPRSPITCEV